MFNKILQKETGCACRDEGLFCTEQCICGTNKAFCKNKASFTTAPGTTKPGKDTFERHTLAVQEARQQITVCRYGLL